jgi:hypothetical protein
MLLRASAEGGGSFPWPSSPGQGKISVLCDLCVSVVQNLLAFNFLTFRRIVCR